MKRFFKYTGISFLFLVILLFLLPVLFRGKIIAMVKEMVNNELQAKVEFTGLDLSLIRNFPRLSVSLHDLSIAGIEGFSTDTLLSVSRLHMAANIMTLFGGKEMKIYRVTLESPRIHALVNSEGRANWDIAKPAEEDSQQGSSSFRMSLKKYTLRDGYILYRDETSGMEAELAGVDHTGSGNFTEEIFTLATSTKAAAMSFRYGGIPYLLKNAGEINARIDVDLVKSRYAFTNASMKLNELSLLLDGSIELKNDSIYLLDMNFNAPSNDFREILSLVPAIYTEQFSNMKTSGTASVSGFIKGEYSSSSFPAYDIRLNIDRASFQYPGIPNPVSNIMLDARLANPDGLPDNASIAIEKAHFEMGRDAFDLRLLYSRPETTRNIDATVKGTVNLSRIPQFVKLPEGTKIEGQVAADAFARGSLAAVENGGGKFSAGGFFHITGFSYSDRDIPLPVRNGNLKIALSNTGGTADATVIDIPDAHLEFGNDPLDFSLTVKKPVSTVDFSGAAKGMLNLAQAAGIMDQGAGTSLKGMVQADLEFAGSKADIDKKLYDRLKLSGTATMQDIRYISPEYPGGINLDIARFSFSPSQIAVNRFEALYRGSRFSGSGNFTNLPGYIMNDQLLRGSMILEVDRLNLNDYLPADTASAGTTASGGEQIFQVPANLFLEIAARAGLVEYDRVSYQKVRGTLLLKDETVYLRDVQADALDGSMAFSGSYSTRRDKKTPDISLDYDIRGVDVQKAFYAYNTFRRLMPAGQFLSGKLSSQFSMTGQLGSDMYPRLESLTGKGNLLLLEGMLRNFRPAEELASTLQLNDLREISFKDLKSYFEFANGRVLVKPFSVRVRDIDMQISGLHGIDQSLDYLVAMKLPRSYMGQQAGNALNSLVQKANASNIPVNISETVNIRVAFAGNITKPVIKTDLMPSTGDMAKEMKQQAADFVQQKADSAKTVIRDTLQSVKNQVIAGAKDEALKQLTGTRDSAIKPAFLDSAKQKTTETIKGLLKKKTGG